ncbi:MAG: hypothetical protein HY820_15475 [Acidobacteria bacterium]|nr:hypothetical protein [Acidobacteriota bacterium]
MQSARLLLFVGVWLIYTVCPPFNSFDSYWSVPVAVSLMERGDTNIDEFLAGMPKPAGYAVECVAEGEGAVPYHEKPASCAEGHAYSFYPLAVSILILPLVGLLKLAVMLLPDLHVGGHPVVAAFLAGDFVAGHAVVELICAALLCALAVLVMERVLAQLVPTRISMTLAVVFAFGTGMWSTASRSLYQHGPLILMLNLTLLLLVKARHESRYVAYAALPLAACFTLRPTGAIWVAMITLFVAVHHRKHLAAFLLWSLPVAVPFLAYNLAMRHSLLPSYYTMTTVVRPFPYAENLLMHLISPSRGLFVFSPFLLLSLLGWVIAFRRRWMFPLLPYLFAGWLLYLVASGAWWPGHSYGPRYFNDTAPVLMMLLVPMLERLGHRESVRVLFALLVAWSIFTHGHGATSVAAQEWNIRPTNIDADPKRVWGWHDPQFLRF